MELIANFVKLTGMESAEQLHFPQEKHPLPDHRIDNYPDPDDPPWGWLTAAGMWFFSVFLIVLMPVIFVMPYVTSITPPFPNSELMAEFIKSDRTSIILQLLSLIPAHLLTLLAAWLIVTKGREFSFTGTLGWRSGGIRWWHYVLIIIGFMGAAYGLNLVMPEQENDLLRIVKSSQTAVYILAIMATFTAPIVEEVVYRGVLYSAFRRAAGVPVAFLVVTFLFAIVHVPQYYPSYSTIILLTLLSVILTSLRVISGNLLPCIILHTLFNGLQSVFIIMESRAEPSDLPISAGYLLRLFY